LNSQPSLLCRFLALFFSKSVSNMRYISINKKLLSFQARFFPNFAREVFKICFLITNISAGNKHNIVSRATLARELRVARACFTAFFLLSRDISLQNTTTRPLKFQRKKLTVPFLAVPSTNKTDPLSRTIHLRNNAKLHFH
jgi:hypothetical protein